MSEPRLYKIIAVPLLISLIIGGIMLFLSSATSDYDTDTYNDSVMQELKDSGEEFNSIIGEYDSDVTTLSSEEAEQDKEGNLISQIWSSTKILTKSYSLFEKMIDTALQNIGIGGYARQIKIVAVALIMCVFIFYLFMKIILKVNL